MKNYIYKLCGEFGLRIFSTAFLLVLARTVGTDEFGLYASASAFASIFMIFVDLGLNPIVTREIARDPAKRSEIVASVNALKTVTALGMLVALAVVPQLLGMPAEKSQIIHWLGWFVVGTAFIDYLSAIFTGLEQMKAEAVLKVISKAIVILTGLIVLVNTRSLLLTVQALAVASVISIIVGAVLVRSRLGTFGFRWNGSYVGALLKLSFPIFGSWAFLVLYDSLHVLMLNLFKTPNESVGLFAAALKIVDVIKIFPILLAGAYFPSLSRLARNDLDAFHRQTREILRYAFVGLPILVGGTYFFAPRILGLLYGPQYLGATSFLRLLLVGFLFLSFNQIAVHWLLALDRERQALYGSVSLCLSSIIFNVLLVQRFGVPGTCYAFVFSNVVHLVVLLFFARHDTGRPATQLPAEVKASVIDAV
jgi:O-antigen/teichoic acid export membrane protein